MCRNNDFIRCFLLELTKTGVPTSLLSSQFTNFPDMKDDLLLDHVDFLVERDFIEVVSSKSGHDFYVITWDGHDFLGYSSDPILWQSATRVAGHLSFDAFYTVLKDLMLWKVRKTADELFQKSVKNK